MDLSLHVGKETIEPVRVVRDLGVLLDEELTMKQHISKVASIAFYHIRRLNKVRSILGSRVSLYSVQTGWPAWLSGSTSVSCQRSFAVLRSTCS